MKAAITILALAIFARADTVELKTGEKIEGRFKQATDAGVVIEVGGQPIAFTLDKVRAIYLGAAPVAQQVPAASGEALDALKAVQAAATLGTSYRDYAPRVVDAKVKVDKYLQSSERGDAVGKAIAVGMRYHELASEAWGTSVSRGPGFLQTASAVGRAVLTDEEISGCQQVKASIAEFDILRAQLKLKPAQGDERAALFGLHLGGRPAVLWACAAGKIAEAEALLKPR